MDLPESALVLPSMTKLESSTIHSIAYDQLNPDITYFYVRFNSKKVYIYEMTLDEAMLHYGLMRGPKLSAGSHFNTNIKDSFPCKEITDLIKTTSFNWSEIFSPNSPIGRRCGLNLQLDDIDLL